MNEALIIERLEALERDMTASKGMVDKKPELRRMLGLDPVEVVISIVCNHFRVHPMRLASKLRTDAIAWPRMVCFYLLRENTRLSLQSIGKAFGGRDHGTVMHGCDRVKDRISVEPHTFTVVKALDEQVKAALNKP
jgi:chromosomal replication initiator protein